MPDGPSAVERFDPDNQAMSLLWSSVPSVSAANSTRSSTLTVFHGDCHNSSSVTQVHPPEMSCHPEVRESSSTSAAFLAAMVRRAAPTPTTPRTHVPADHVWSGTKTFHGPLVTKLLPGVSTWYSPNRT